MQSLIKEKGKGKKIIRRFFFPLMRDSPHNYSERGRPGNKAVYLILNVYPYRCYCGYFIYVSLQPWKTDYPFMHLSCINFFFFFFFFLGGGGGGGGSIGCHS